MFEPEELMARIVDLEAQLKVSEMAPPAAEQLIACLEGEIAKRDERIVELERYRFAFNEWHDKTEWVQAESATLSAKYLGCHRADVMRSLIDDLREELAACRVAVENCEVFRARIAELEARYQRDVWGLNNECDPIGGDPAGGYANDNARLRAELAAIKAQEPIAWYTEDHLDDKSATTYSWTVAERWVEKGWPVSPLYAAPVSEAKAQGDAWAPSVNDYDHSIHSNPDAREWADFFVATFPGLADKHDLMIGWFANAMMAMHDHLARKAQGVVMPPSPYMPGSQPTDFTDYELGEIHGRIAMWEEVKRLNASPVQQVSVPDGWKHGLPPEGEICEARIPHHTADGRQMIWCEVEVIAHSIINGAIYSWVKETGRDGSFYAPMMLSFRKLAAAPAAPAADAGHVFYGMDGDHP